MVGIITSSGPGLGDKIQFTSFPENYYKNTGEKVVDFSNNPLFDNNPYVVRGQKCERVIDLWRQSHKQYAYKDQISSLSERMRFYNSLEKVYLRHPRLYVHEDNDIIPQNIVCHFDGKSKGKTPEYVIEQIKKNYKNFNLIQIGGSNDRIFEGFDNKLGLNVFDTAEIISKSSLFIGCNSSMMNLSLCYPRVNKRVILTEDENRLRELIPMESKNGDSHWLDWSLVLFNCSEEDIGVTTSFRKI